MSHESRAISRTGSPHARSHLLLPAFWQIFLSFLLPTLAILAVLTFLLYRYDLDNEYSTHHERGRHIVELHSEIIAREVEAVRTDLHYLRQHPTLLDFLTDPTPSALERLRIEYVLFSRQRGLYDQIRYLDEKGQEIVRVNYHGGTPAAVPSGELQEKSTRYYFTETMALPAEKTFVSPMDLNVEHGEVETPLKPVIRFGTPVHDESGARRGIVVLNYLGSHVLRMLDEADSGEDGLVMLLDKEGGYIRGPSNGERSFLLGSRRRFADERPDAWARVADVDSGEHVDPSGVYTYRRVALGAETDPALLVVRHMPHAAIRRRPGELLGRLVLLEILVVLIVAGPSWLLARSRAVRRAFQDRLAESEVRLRSLSAQLLSTQEDERRKISRDLHDDLGQIITATTLSLERARVQNQKKERDELIQTALEGTRLVLRRVHEMSSRLRPSLLDDLGLIDAVRSYSTEYESRHSIAVHLTLRVEPGTPIPATVEENVYRILQEALTNVAKYAQVAEVSVDIEADGDSIGLSIVDEGLGFRLADVDPTSLGLLGMRERAELLDGTFELVTELGAGTRIRVDIPLSRPKNPAENLSE